MNLILNRVNVRTIRLTNILILSIAVSLVGCSPDTTSQDNQKEKTDISVNVNEQQLPSQKQTNIAETKNETRDKQTVLDTPTGIDSNGNFYADAEIINLRNGGGKIVGSFSIVKADQNDCTDQALLNWYFDYVKNNSNCSYHIILYSDNPKKGVYSTGDGFISKDVILDKNKNGSYSVASFDGSDYLTVSESTKTFIDTSSVADESLIEDATRQVNFIVPGKYKTGDLYSVDISGEVGELDCILTLESASLKNADCHGIAVDMAKKIKELNLGISYLCIAFQSDDYTMEALSIINDLINQDVSEMSTKSF